MIRRGDWKLSYYHGQPPQLFNLRDDPDELVDRAEDPACRDLRAELTREVLRGWDPDAVGAEMVGRRAELPILTRWARQVDPPDVHRWSLLPEMDRLDAEPPA